MISDDLSSLALCSPCVSRCCCSLSLSRSLIHARVASLQKKKDEASSLYTTVNAELITQLQATVGRKGELLIQVFNNFEHIERQVAETYMAAVSSPGAVSMSSMASGSSAGAAVSEFTSRMGDMGKHRANGEVDSDSGVAISLGMEGQAEGQSDAVGNTRGSLTTPGRSAGGYRSTTPPPPSYTPNANLPAPTAAPRRPSSPQPHPPPPPPPPPAKHV